MRHILRFRDISLIAPLFSCGCVAEPADGDEILDVDGEILPVEPGDVVDVGPLSVIAPSPGMTVWSEIVFADGSTRTLAVETSLDGIVFRLPINDHADVDAELPLGAAPSPADAASPAACSDSAFSKTGWKWTATYKWLFKADSTPSEITRDAAEGKLKEAVTNITKSRNNCNLDDQVSASQYYLGRTSKGININSTGTCTSNDGSNVIAFGDLPSNIAAVACTWSSGGTGVESDIRINKGDHKWTSTPGSGCKNSLSLEAVMTHEFGHTFGLGHVSESTHASLTMSTHINGICQNDEATLGLGDVKGLRSLY